jgi:hypothetical protein
MAVPLGFAKLDWQTGDQKEPFPQTLALLGPLSRYAERITLFYQEDRIAVPARYRELMAFIEPSLVPVRPPLNRSFHPKVWALRFVGDANQIAYRLLVLSRNLTFARSWDTALVLDGEFLGRQNAYAGNHPLGDFFAALPAMAATQPPSEEVKDRVALVEREIRRVRFAPPSGFSGLSYWPLGLKRGRVWPFEGDRAKKALVVSPFADEGCLRALESTARQPVLVSELSSLETIRSTLLERFGGVYFLQDRAMPDAQQLEADDALWNEAPLVGLHAKFYAVDRGSTSSVWTGSANATTAAFNGNIEFMVQLDGPRRTCGVDAILDDDGKTSALRSMLQPYTPAEPVPFDETKARLEKRLRLARNALASLELRARVEGAEGEEGLHLVLCTTARASAFEDSITVACRPLSMHESRLLTMPAVLDQPLLVFGPLSPEMITPFFVFELEAAEGDQRLRESFVLLLPLDNDLEDRKERVLLKMLENRENVRRYLLLLLAQDAPDAAEAMSVRTSLFGGDGRSQAPPAGFPLFETMIKALYRNPQSLDRVAELVQKLSSVEGGREKLPEGFLPVWEPIWRVKEALRDGR